jgi:hypothetical protein
MSPEPEISRVTSDERNVPTQGVLERLFALAMEVLGNEANVLAWLKTPHAVWGVKPTTSSARCNFFDGERDDRSVSKNRWIRNGRGVPGLRWRNSRGVPELRLHQKF